ncbi:hypothetical protein ZEAMMB73_Zm00001d023281 [Zea mays]|nr:hypothetical protein ZEAMMB73_Zm00001d023281 [Zea mays]AQK38840.1 hypothetical protein ZEAMMB73_Zm00001d023281 [Zea mays]
MGLNAVVAACYVFPVLVSVLAVRFFYVLWHSGQPESRLCATRLRCLIVLGSGGHTAEMMNIVTTLQKDRFTPRYYVAALTDNMSLQKAQVYEQSLIQVLGLGWSSIFYIESIARVKKLSLSVFSISEIQNTVAIYAHFDKCKLLKSGGACCRTGDVSVMNKCMRAVTVRWPSISAIGPGLGGAGVACARIRAEASMSPSTGGVFA